MDAAPNSERFQSDPLQTLQVPRIYREDEVPMWSQVAPLPDPQDRPPHPLVKEREEDDQRHPKGENQQNRGFKKFVQEGTANGRPPDSGKESCEA